MTDHGRYPGGARFAFTILDDADDGRVDNLRPIYDLLTSLGMRTTKTLWPFRFDGPSHFFACETLDDPGFREWAIELHGRGFEVSWHCASYESSERERTVAALARLHDLFGVTPRVHANHSHNRENLYWGQDRFDLPLLGTLVRLAQGTPRDHYGGHVPGTPFWWGDLCEGTVVYARNLTFSELNLARMNPSMPYADPRRPLVPYWFSTSDAENVEEFNTLTAPERIEKLESEGGFTIVSTHLGKGFVKNGEVDPTTRRNLEFIAGRKGWYPTTGELLDWLKEHGGGKRIPRSEWLRMQTRYATDLARRAVNDRFAMRRRSPPPAEMPSR